MRVCQFRHYGTVSKLGAQPEAEHTNREYIVLQTAQGMSMFGWE
ncbi:MAG: hypothetical protein QOE55_2593 [Acidobacteriaceae bacterium]|nr:hypothetical protein [Acidobacteriaceae bacterium]